MEDHVKSVCKIGQGHDCCRYLLMSKHGFECAKNTEGGEVRSLMDMLTSGKKYQSSRELLDARVAVGEMIAQGDNCEGKSIEQLNTINPTKNES